MKIYRLLPIAFAGVLTLGLFGCAGGQSNDNKEASSSSQTTSEEVAKDSTENNAAQKATEEEAAKKASEETAKKADEKPIELDANEYASLHVKNKAKAIKEYNGKLVQLTGYITRVGSDTCTIAPSPGSTVNTIDASMPIDVLAELEDGDKVTVQGYLEVPDVQGPVTVIRNAEIVG